MAARPAGLAVLITGLPSAGKTTLARGLLAPISARTGFPAVHLDGDATRPVLCPDLGFSDEDRITNLTRVAFVAAKVVESGGVVVCSYVSPSECAREIFHASIHEVGGRCALVFLDVPAHICAEQDPKGHYAKAEAGEIEYFTGVSAPYEKPTMWDVRIGPELDAGTALVHTIAGLEAQGFIPRRKDQWHEKLD